MVRCHRKARAGFQRWPGRRECTTLSQEVSKSQISRFIQEGGSDISVHLSAPLSNLRHRRLSRKEGRWELTEDLCWKLSMSIRTVDVLFAAIIYNTRSVSGLLLTRIHHPELGTQAQSVRQVEINIETILGALHNLPNSISSLDHIAFVNSHSPWSVLPSLCVRCLRHSINPSLQ